MNTLVSIVIAAFAAAFAIFHTYPAPPKSPLLYQWEKEDGGSYFKFQDYDIFFKGKFRRNFCLAKAETAVL